MITQSLKQKEPVKSTKTRSLMHDNEIVGTVTVELEYQKPEWTNVKEKPFTPNLKLSQIEVKYTELDSSAYPNMLPQVKVRCGENLV